MSGIRRQLSHARAAHITDWRYKEEPTRLLVGNSSEDASSDVFVHGFLRHRRRPLEDVSSLHAHAKVTWHSGTNRRPEAAGSRSRLDLIRGGKRRNGRGSNQLMSRPALRLPCFDTNLVILSIVTLAREPFAMVVLAATRSIQKGG